MRRLFDVKMFLDNKFIILEIGFDATVCVIFCTYYNVIYK